MTAITTSIRTVPALRPRVGLAGTVSHSLTMAYRALLKIKRTPEQWVDVFLQPILFTGMFAYIFGGAISGSVEDYLPILIPGILVQSVITTSIVTGTQLREDMEKGVFDRFRSLPIARIAPLAGPLLTDTIRYGIATGMTFLVGFLIGWRPEGGWWVLLAAMLVVVTAWAISWIWALLGVVARTAGTVQGVGIMILFPLTFLSNAYVPVETLPDWLAAFANVNPISHLVTAVRDLANQGTIGADVGWTLLGAAVIVAVFAPLTVRAYMRRA